MFFPLSEKGHSISDGISTGQGVNGDTHDVWDINLTPRPLFKPTAATSATAAT